jgi:hypothetical protein
MMQSIWAGSAADLISSTALSVFRRSSAFTSGATQKAGSNVGTEGNDDGFTTVAGGVILRFPAGNITPFAHGLAGGALVGGPYYEPNRWGPDLTAGGGLDYETPWLNHHSGHSAFPGRL